MPLTPTQASAAVAALLDASAELFYDGERPTVFGEAMVPIVIEVPGAQPNGNLAPATGGYGIEASQGLLGLDDEVAIKFALAHEAGHGMSERILADIGLHGISGPATEVIADLASAYLLTRVGHSWPEVLTSVRAWRQTGIFDEHASGDHPAGADRVRHVETLAHTMAQQPPPSFGETALAICQSL
jgi:hypothetical protein